MLIRDVTRIHRRWRNARRHPFALHVHVHVGVLIPGPVISRESLRMSMAKEETHVETMSRRLLRVDQGGRVVPDDAGYCCVSA